MSEYQYYEFLAIDRQLTSKEMSTLRNISSRADITTVSLTNVYNFGDFKGNPTELVQRYFDAHVYMANWGTAVFMINLPFDAMTQDTVDAVQVEDFLDFKATKNHWVITWSLDEPEDFDRFALDDGQSWMKRLAPIRDELLRGDLRSLYIGWLAAVTQEMVDDEDLEPLAIEGLGYLTPAQQALAEFLEVDTDLLAGSGMGSPAFEDPELKQEMVDEWLNNLSQEEVRSILNLLLAGQGLQAERKLKGRFESWLRSFPNPHRDMPLRTVEEIRQNSESAQKMRLDKERQKQKRQEEKRRQKRQAYLNDLATDFSKAWQGIQKTVARGSGSAYKEACQGLADLSEAYLLYSSPEAFEQELNQFMEGHMRRKAFIRRLVEKGFLDQELRAKKPIGKKS